MAFCAECVIKDKEAGTLDCRACKRLFMSKPLGMEKHFRQDYNLVEFKFEGDPSKTFLYGEKDDFFKANPLYNCSVEGCSDN